MISVVLESTPPGNGTRNLNPLRPAPMHKPTPAARIRAQMPPRPAPPRLVRGTRVPARRAGLQIVAATHPAVADTNNLAPLYPSLARALGEQGVVVLRVWVLPSGAVAQVEITHSCGYPSLDESALTSVRNYHFRPAYRNGVPVASVLPYWIRFELQ